MNNNQQQQQQKSLDPTKKYTLHTMTKGEPQRNGRRGKIMIKSKPLCAR